MRLSFWLTWHVLAFGFFHQSDLIAQTADNPGVLLVPDEVYEQIATRADLGAPPDSAAATVDVHRETQRSGDVALPSSVPYGTDSITTVPSFETVQSSVPGIDQNWGPNDSVVLPNIVDLREFLPTPGKQTQNDCVAWAAAYAAYSCQIGQERRRKPTFASDQFSPEYVYNQLSSDGGGLTILQAVDFLKLNGCASRACLNPVNGQISSNAAVEANSFKLLDNARARNLDDIKLYLHEGYPVILVVRMKGDFRADDAIEMPYVWTESSSDDVNYHAIAAVGYDDEKQALLLMNSWGTQWKDEGCCWASYDNFTSVDKDHWCVEAHVLKVKGSAPFDVWMQQSIANGTPNPFLPPPPAVWRHFSLKNDRKVYENNQVISPASWKVDGVACNNKNLFLLARDQTVYQMREEPSGVSWSHLSRDPLDDEKVCMMAAVDSKMLHVLTENQTLYKFDIASADWSIVPLPQNDLKPIDLRTINNQMRVITDKGTVFQKTSNGEWGELTRILP
ncbi:C1 family peptidase [Rhodopirellula bahusiensis]|uniref:Peptidase C1 n=1 Tax=Rhodopirellula bahusiensis TaxID=2014065 RepID=A0A2G1W7C0_9BACT|nr:C1 family peptidase [Rhodopirellula bahusiensis]PHQ34730.1 peptidase C1 [Rhodopirellula bahusiensis]